MNWWSEIFFVPQESLFSALNGLSFRSLQEHENQWRICYSRAVIINVLSCVSLSFIFKGILHRRPVTAGDPDDVFPQNTNDHKTSCCQLSQRWPMQLSVLSENLLRPPLRTFTKPSKPFTSPIPLPILHLTCFFYTSPMLSYITLFHGQIMSIWSIFKKPSCFIESPSCSFSKSTS